MSRADLANDIAAGLAGWYQLQVTQKLGDLPGEDSARFLAAQIVNAQGRFEPRTSQRPPNWGSSKKRVDLGLAGRSSNAAGWYGAIEVKWPGAAFDPHQTRLQTVQDAMRLSFIETGNVNAKLLVLGGSANALTILFDTTHPQAADREQRRQAFNDLFQRDLQHPNGMLTSAIWTQQFPGAGDRVPDGTFANFDGRLKAELLASVDASVRGQAVGHVYVWQCNRTRGTAP